jgi:hypothetical protein
MLTMENLENCFNAAKKLDKNFVGVVLTLPNAPGEEVIINGKENFDEKLKYYQSTYDENLNHKHVPNLKIVGFTFGNTFDHIQYDLFGK